MQWVRWLLVMLLMAAAYVLAYIHFFDGDWRAAGNLLGADQLSLLMPAVAVFFLLAYEMRWDGINRGRRRHRGDSESDPPTGSAPSGELPKGTSEPKAAVTPVEAPKPAETAVNANGESAQQLWDRAREMPHGVVPNPRDDFDYLALVHEAADLGHIDALMKLSDYAVRRGMSVEAFFWGSLAVRSGARGVDGWLGGIKVAWMSSGCPGEYENVDQWFTEARGSVSRALLRIACAVDAPIARRRLRELAEAGNADAIRFTK